MAGKISLTPAEMTARINEVGQAEQDYIAVFNKMKRIMSNLQQEWHGQASESFARQFEDLKNRSFEPMTRLLYDLGAQMRETLRVIEETDARIAGKLGAN